MIVARRYARALYEEGERQSKTAAVDEDVAAIQSIMESSRELASFFRSPVIPAGKKESIVKELFGKRVDPVTLSFLNLLIRKEREDVLFEILRAYSLMRDEQRGIVEVHARTAMPMPDEERVRLVRALEDLTEREVRLHLHEEADLIGGIVIRIGDVVYDASVRRQLDRLRERMEAGSYLLN